MQHSPPKLLSDAQLRELRRLSSSRHTPAYIARRAEAVLDEHRARATGAPRNPVMSRQTARKWFQRYRDTGPAGLQDAPRRGRPPGARDPAAQAVMLAPLFVDSPRWTSRSIAAATNCSQSAVTRVWKRTFVEARTSLGESLPAGGLALEACFSALDCSILVLRLQAGPGQDAPSHADFMRSALRPSLQTVLATDVLIRSAPQPAATSHWSRMGATVSGVAVAVTRSAAGHGDASPRFVLCTPPSIATTLREHFAPSQVLGVERSRWQGLLLDVGPRLSSDSLRALLSAQHRAMEWARTHDGPLIWTRTDAPPSAEPALRPNPRTHVPLATSELVRDTILSTLERDIMAGRLGGGDRITETYLAHSAHAPRGQVRDALRILASRGIIELQHNRGAVVPTPQVDDVVETYAARRALGALIVRRAAESPLPGYLPTCESALRTMLEAARTGDSWTTGDNDLRFQEVIADMTGMRRISVMFSGITAQLRMFVAVLGVRYAYSVSAICQDNIALMQLIKDGNGPGAVSRWNSKMNDAANYMLQQLDHSPSRL